jgi:L-ribulokinase
MDRSSRPSMKIALGLDFGTESVRALLVDLAGRERASKAVAYSHSQITTELPGSGAPLPPHFALQHPKDWMDSAGKAVRAALRSARVSARDLVGIGVDFTSCTMLPAKADGTPLCLLEAFADRPHAWPKLWKHHAAQAQTDRLNAVARKRNEPFLQRYGGSIGLEWFFPKMLEVLENDPAVYHAADLWVEAGDWFVWQLTGGPASELPRSTCQAGYKGLWHPADGYPSEKFLRAVHPEFASVVRDKMPGRLLAPGTPAGLLTEAAATQLGLRTGIPVSAAIIDAHAGVPGAGASEPDTLVMVMGTSSCHMLNSRTERLAQGIAGVVPDGILPGFFGYETGQAAVGDAFEWLRKLTGQTDLSALTERASKIPPGAEGVRCVDWLNGCRTPLMDGALSGAFTGLHLHHTPAHLYRALLEGSAFGVRWIVDVLREGEVPVRQFIATGGLPHHNPLAIQVYADVLGAPITVHPCKQGPALGAAILGALAARAFSSPKAAIRAMATPEPGSAPRFLPDRSRHKLYSRLYADYRRLAAFLSSPSGT